MIWLLIFLVVIIWIALTLIDRDDDNGFFTFLMSVLVLFCMAIGVMLQENVGVCSNKPIKPSVKIECTDGKCDTTYTYK